MTLPIRLFQCPSCDIIFGARVRRGSDDNSNYIVSCNHCGETLHPKHFNQKQEY